MEGVQDGRHGLPILRIIITVSLRGFFEKGQTQSSRLPRRIILAPMARRPFLGWTIGVLFRRGCRRQDQKEGLGRDVIVGDALPVNPRNASNGMHGQECQHELLLCGPFQAVPQPVLRAQSPSGHPNVLISTYTGRRKEVTLSTEWKRGAETRPGGRPSGARLPQWQLPGQSGQSHRHPSRH